MNYTVEEKEVFMREALREAEIALEHDEIPIGCVIVKDGEIIGRGHNAREELQRAVQACSRVPPVRWTAASW